MTRSTKLNSNNNSLYGNNNSTTSTNSNRNKILTGNSLSTAHRDVHNVMGVGENAFDDRTLYTGRVGGGGGFSSIATANTSQKKQHALITPIPPEQMLVKNVSTFSSGTLNFINKRRTKSRGKIIPSHVAPKIAMQLRALFLQSNLLDDHDIQLSDVEELRNVVLMVTDSTARKANDTEKNAKKNYATSLETLFQSIDSEDHTEIQEFAMYLVTRVQATLSGGQMSARSTSSDEYDHEQDIDQVTNNHSMTMNVSGREAREKADRLYHAFITIATAVRRKRVELSIKHDGETTAKEQIDGFKNLFSMNYFPEDQMNEMAVVKKQQSYHQHALKERLKNIRGLNPPAHSHAPPAPYTKPRNGAGLYGNSKGGGTNALPFLSVSGQSYRNNTSNESLFTQDNSPVFISQSASPAGIKQVKPSLGTSPMGLLPEVRSPNSAATINHARSVLVPVYGASPSSRNSNNSRGGSRASTASNNSRQALPITNSHNVTINMRSPSISADQVAQSLSLPLGRSPSSVDTGNSGGGQNNATPSTKSTSRTPRAGRNVVNSSSTHQLTSSSSLDLIRPRDIAINTDRDFDYEVDYNVDDLMMSNGKDDKDDDLNNFYYDPREYLVADAFGSTSRDASPRFPSVRIPDIMLAPPSLKVR